MCQEGHHLQKTSILNQNWVSRYGGCCDSWNTQAKRRSEEDSYGPWTQQWTQPSPSTLCIDEVVSKMADFLPSRSVLSAFFPNCLLTSGEAEQLRKSKEIDKCIHRDKTYVKRLVKILLLGAGESGKSTFLKQMRIIHGQDFDQKAKEEFRATIFSNVIKGKPTLYRLLFTYWNRFVPTFVVMWL